MAEKQYSRRRFLKYAVIGSFIAIVVFAVTGYFLSSQPQRSFGIYLLENNKLVISEEDIVWYNRTSHEVRLTELGVKKIKELQVLMHGSPFVIKINGENICNGSFVSPISSFLPPSVVIVTLVQDNTIKIQRGYPSSQLGAEDPRDNPKILEYFQKVKKLVQ